MTNDAKVAVQAAILQGLTYSEFVGSTLGLDHKDEVSPKYYRDKKSDMKQQGQLGPTPTVKSIDEILGEDFVAELAQQERENAQIAALKAENKRLRDTIGGYYSLLSDLKLGFDELPAAELPTPSISAMGGQGSTVVLPLYDVHIGHTFNKAYGQYGIDLFAQQAVDLQTRLMRDLDGLSHSRDLKKLVVVFGGDIIEGRTIFKGQSKESMPLREQICTGSQVMVDALLAPLVKAFPSVDIFAVPGNHGRLGDKGELEKVDDNLDIIFTEFIKLQLRGTDHLDWHSPEAPYSYFNLHGFNFLASHGDGFKSWGGIPFYGASKNHGKMQNFLHNIIDVLLVGHHHSPADFNLGWGRVIMMNNWAGPSEFCAALALGGYPSQKVIIADDTDPAAITIDYRFRTDGCPTVEPIQL